MTRKADRQPHHRCFNRRAFTLVESAISMIILSVTIVAALNTVSASVLGRRKTGDQGRAVMLAQDLMAEILEQDYAEPVDPPVFGAESGESGGSRANYDDVDDYAGWTSTPPEYRDGTKMLNLLDHRRTVTVVYADPTDLTLTAAFDTGIKRITVSVADKDKTLAELVAIRTSVAPLTKMKRDLPVAKH